MISIIRNYDDNHKQFLACRKLILCIIGSGLLLFFWGKLVFCSSSSIIPFIIPSSGVNFCPIRHPPSSHPRSTIFHHPIPHPIHHPTFWGKLLSYSSSSITRATLWWWFLWIILFILLSCFRVKVGSLLIWLKQWWTILLHIFVKNRYGTV